MWRSANLPLRLRSASLCRPCTPWWLCPGCSGPRRGICREARSKGLRLATIPPCSRNRDVALRAEVRGNLRGGDVVARNRARKADRRANAIDAGVPYSKVPTNRRDDGLQLQPCWEGCQSQYLAWRNASGSMSWCAWGDHPVCMDCQRRPVIDGSLSALTAPPNRPAAASTSSARTLSAAAASASPSSVSSSRRSPDGA